MFRFLLEVVLFLVAFLFIFNQFIYPLWKRQKLFPLFRRKENVTNELKDVNDQIEIEEEKITLGHKKNVLNQLKTKNQKKEK